VLGPGWFFGRWSRACSATITSLHVLPQQEMLPNFMARQKKSWVDSGSGSLPSEW